MGGDGKWPVSKSGPAEMEVWVSSSSIRKRASDNAGYVWLNARSMDFTFILSPSTDIAFPDRRENGQFASYSFCAHLDSAVRAITRAY
jgi:hypothetical protein